MSRLNLASCAFSHSFLRFIQSKRVCFSSFLRGFRTQFNKTKYYEESTSSSKARLASRDISLFHQHILHGALPCRQLPAPFGRKIYAKTIDFIYRGKRNFDDQSLFYEMVAIEPTPSKELLCAKSDDTEKIHEDDRF